MKCSAEGEGDECCLVSYNVILEGRMAVNPKIIMLAVQAAKNEKIRKVGT